MINMPVSLGVNANPWIEKQGEYMEPRHGHYFNRDYLILEVKKEGITVELLYDATVRVRTVGGDGKYLLVRNLPMPMESQSALPITGMGHW